MSILRGLTQEELKGDEFEKNEKTRSHAAYEVKAKAYRSDANTAGANAFFGAALVAEINTIFKLKCSSCGAFHHSARFCPLEKILKNWVKV